MEKQSMLSFEEDCLERLSLPNSQVEVMRVSSPPPKKPCRPPELDDDERRGRRRREAREEDLYEWSQHVVSEEAAELGTGRLAFFF